MIAAVMLERPQESAEMKQRIAAAVGGLWRDRSGVTAVLTALGAVVLLGFTGLAIDVVTWEVAQHKMQSAADAAALAASIAAYTDQNATNAADAVAASYGYVNGQNGTNVTVTSPYSGNGAQNGVQVVISQSQPQFFSRLFLASAPTVTVQAAARLPAGSGSMCVMTLGGSGKLAVGDATFTGNTTVNMSTCDLYNNSTAANSTELNGSSTLDVRNMYLAGDYTRGGSARLSISGTAATYVTPANDPYAAMSIPSYSGCSQTNYTLGPSQSFTINPGSTPYVFCGNTDIKGTLTLGPGTYIIDGGNFTAESQATITGTGVTIIPALRRVSRESRSGSTSTRRSPPILSTAGRAKTSTASSICRARRWIIPADRARAPPVSS
jgi:Flp pilus assembly protein TadG